MIYKVNFMKFRYNGKRMGNVQLAVAGVIGMGECLKKGEVYDVPDDNKELITGCKLHPYFEEVANVKKQSKKEKVDE